MNLVRVNLSVEFESGFVYGSHVVRGDTLLVHLSDALELAKVCNLGRVLFLFGQLGSLNLLLGLMLFEQLSALAFAHLVYVFEAFLDCWLQVFKPRLNLSFESSRIVRLCSIIELLRAKLRKLLIDKARNCLVLAVVRAAESKHREEHMTQNRARLTVGK